MQDATAVQTRPAMPTSVPNTAILANRSDTRKFKVFAPSLKRKSWSQRQKEEMLRLREELITLSAIVRSKNSTPVTMYQDKTRSSWKTAAVLEFQRLQTSMNEGAKLRESVKRCKVEAERIQNAFTKNLPLCSL